MSCSLLYQNDWLEYENNLSWLSKIGAVLMIAVGAALFYYQVKIGNIKTARLRNKNLRGSVNTGALDLLLKILLVISALIIALPLFFLFFSFGYPTSQPTSKPILFISSAVMVILSLVTFSVVAAINIELTNIEGASFPIEIWLPTLALVILSSGFLFYRWKSRSNIPLKKQNINWKSKNNSALVEKIGQKQAKSCGVALKEGESVASLIYYLDRSQQEFNENNGLFGRIFNSNNDAPSDKIPNIIKMNALARESEIKYRESKKQTKR